MQDSKSTADVLGAVKDIGIRLALDDFGTGYSSLSYMRRFPIDILKVDKSFVRDLTADADDASVVSAVISMGKSLHMGVIAEGVETQAQLQFLEDHDCPEGQGNYFSCPLAAREVGGLLRQGIRHVLSQHTQALFGSPPTSCIMPPQGIPAFIGRRGSKR
jgi:EAL domain-containing protein (putative c-di-GMP-specific phosphodiesterase class I)